MRKGIVVDTHPEDMSVDLVMVDDASRLIGIQLLGNGSERSGSVDLPEVPTKKDKWDLTELTGQEIHAVIDYVGRTPVVVGFLYPQVNQMLFKDKKLKFSRHQSDFYTVTDGDGNMEMHHPSGWYCRIAESPDHVDLTGKNVDGTLAFDRNTERSLYMRVHMPGGAAVLTIDPSGHGDMYFASGLDVRSDKHISFTAVEDISLTSQANINTTASGDTKITSTGNVAVKGAHIGLND